LTPPDPAGILGTMSEARSLAKDGTMHRSAAALVALFLLPGTLLAQEPDRVGGGEAGTHTVERGESLWSLARRYYDNPFFWRNIYEANEDRIDNPHWIYPGQHLVLPGLEGSGEVTAVEVEGGREPGGRGTATGIAPAPGDPTVFSDPPRDDTPRPQERTAFHRESNADVLTTVVGGENRNYLAIPRDLFYAAEWLVPPDAGIRFPGEVVGWFGAAEAQERRRTVQPYEQVRVAWEGAPLPQEGDRLLVVRSSRTERGLGTVIRPTGMLRVDEVSGEAVVATATNEYHRLRMEDRVLPAPPFPLEPGLHPTRSDDDLTARILAFAEPRPLQQLGDVAFLDIGRADGVQVGDEFVVDVGSGGGWSPRTVGRVQVVRAFEEVSSARIVELEGPVFVAGTEVRRARRMP